MRSLPSPCNVTQLLGLILLAVPLAAQSVLGPSAAPATVPGTASQSTATTPTSPSAPGGGDNLTEGRAGAATQAAPFALGPVGVRPHLVYRYTHGDGVQAQPGLEVTTTLQEVSPGFTADLGGTWTFDYTAHQTWYSREEFKDSLGHNLSLQGAQNIGTWILSFSQAYAKSETPLIETARQTRQESASTSVRGGCPLSSNTAIDLSASQQYQSAGGQGESYNRTAMGWINHQTMSRVTLGLGLGVGTMDIADRPDLSFQRQLARASWQMTSKFTIAASGGVEARHERTPGAATTKIPNYSLQLGYAPFDYTRLSLEAGRSSSVSSFNNQVNDGSQWAVSLQQRLLGKFQLSTHYSSQRSRFLAAIALLETSRSDTQKSFNVRLGATLRTRGTVGVSYQRRTNDSSLEGYSLGSDQIGVDLGWRY